MKPAAFRLCAARRLWPVRSHCCSARTLSVKLLAGGQSLGPMLNLRLAQPDLLVDITAVPDLLRVETEDDGLLIGACVTHADIEDGRVPDPTARGPARSRPRDRLSCRAQPGHHWRQPGPCRSGRGLDLGPRRAWRGGDHARASGPAPPSGRAVHGRSVRGGAGAGRTARGDPTCRGSRPAGAGGSTSSAARPASSRTPSARCSYDPERAVCRVVIGATEVDADRGGRRGVVVRWSARGRARPDLRSRHAARLLDDRGIRDPFERQIHLVALERAVHLASRP